MAADGPEEFGALYLLTELRDGVEASRGEVIVSVRQGCHGFVVQAFYTCNGMRLRKVEGKQGTDGGRKVTRVEL